MPKHKRSNSNFYVPSEDSGGNGAGGSSSPGSIISGNNQQQHEQTTNTSISIDNSNDNGSSAGNKREKSPKMMEKAGWLHKWTNYVKGYRQRWFVLDKQGNLKYFRNAIEANGPPRGSINLTEARIHSGQHHGSCCELVITTARPSQTFHLKAANEVERTQWLKALEYAKHRAIHTASTLEDDEDENNQFLAKSNGFTQLKAEDLHEETEALRTASEKFTKDLEGFTHYAQGHMGPNEAKKCADKAQPLKQQADELTKTTSEVLAKCKKDYDALSRMANTQNEQYQEIQKQYEILARQHSQLETDAIKIISSGMAISEKSQESSQPDNDNTSIKTQPSAPYLYESGRKEDNNTNKSATTQQKPTRNNSSTKEGNDREEEEEEDQFHDASDHLDNKKMTAATTMEEDGESRDDSLEQSQNGTGTTDENGGGRNNDNGNAEGGEEQQRRNSNAPRIVMGNSAQKVDLSKCTIHMPSKLANYHENTEPVSVPTGQPARKRREKIPPKPESHGMNLWSIIRNCIGKELTKIPVPVNFNEPLSMLQRITEDLEYSYLLDRAAEKDDICERLAYVAAYAITSYSGTAKRTTKPFNPLLGETFEFDRRKDLGWRSLVEQVSHHPPAAAHHAEGANWNMHQEFVASSCFRGTYLRVIPTGYTHVEFNDGKAMCTFQKITTTIHNIIIGKLWIENHGDMCIQNHVGDGERAIIKFHPYSYFSSNRPKKVEGLILNGQGEARYYLHGYWDQHISIAPVIEEEGTSKRTIRTDAPRRIWTANKNCAGPSMFNFTKFAIELNEPDEWVAPTDSRRRPDQRLMEEGEWDEANKRKNQLEDKQRKRLRQAEAEVEKAMNNDQEPDEYCTRWFQKVQEAHTGSVIHVIRDEEYWKCKERQDWSRCPDIF